MSEQLFDRLRATGRLPTPPGVVLQLLELTRREDVSASEIADTLARDPALAAKILRFANSPMAGVSREVTSLQRAVALMGVRGVKMTALSFAVLGTGDGNPCRGFDQQQFGVQSVGCAVAARVLAAETKMAAPQEAFLAGLLSQLGRSVLAIALPEEYADVLAEAREIPRDLPPLERRALGDDYAAIGAQLLGSWGIPETLCEAIREFRRLDEMEEASPLAKVLCAGEIAAGVICPETKGAPPDSEAFVEAAKSLLGIQHDRCAPLISEIAGETESTRAMLEMPKGTMRSPEDIQNEVRERIAELSLAMHLENQAMADQQDELMRRATTDALTGIGNRAAFNARILLELERSARSGAPVALLMIDVDRFKSFNDTHGHQAGDLVLQTVARVLDANVRKVDCLARYGGEEFAVIAPDTTADGVLALAERLRRCVAEASVEWEGKRLRVAVSIGVAVCGDTAGGADASRIIQTADEQLYAAKSAGRNRVKMALMDCTVAGEVGPSR